jgi:glycosyltransferase involved in cell wall biosynthesis
LSNNQTRHLVVTLPVYKDTRFLGATAVLLEEATKAIEEDFTLLIAEDGSNSSPTVDELKWKYRNIVHLQNDRRLGRGKALREAWQKVRGNVYVYVDVDLATDLMKFDAYRNLIEMASQFDLVTGSRYISGSITNRPLIRRTASTMYNWLVRMLFRTGVHDHQCGFKSFSRRLVERLAVEARSDSWFWDTEVIVLAKKMGFTIKEITIQWTEKKGSRTPLKRLLRDVWLHGTGLLALLYRIYFSDLGRNLS